MRICERLKVHNEFFGCISFPEIFDPFRHLIGNGFQPVGASGAKGCIVAVGAASGPDGSVAVRTGESSVNADLIDPAAEFFS